MALAMVSLVQTAWAVAAVPRAKVILSLESRQGLLEMLRRTQS
jgi:hypothetical protein